MTSYQHISYAVEEAAAVIRLGTDGHIFLTSALCEELDAALSLAASDAQVRGVILTGANEGVFMRHFSVAEILELAHSLRAQGVKPGDDLPHADAPIDRCLRQVEQMDKPVIAAINGECMGGAMELSLGCDIRFARNGVYRLGQPETILGILPGAGGTQRLARVVGPARAMEHALTGLPISPEEAHRIGLVHALFDDPLAAARDRVRHFAAIPPVVLAHTKRLVREQPTTPLEQGLKNERKLFLDLALRDEGVALMTAYEAGAYRFQFENGAWRADIPKVW